MKPVTDPTPTTRTPLPAAAPLMVWHRRLEGADVDGGLHDSPDARALLAMWRAAHARAEGRLPGRDFVSNARAQHDAWLALLAPQEGAGFRLCHYGTALSQASGMATQREDYEGLPTEERNFFEVWLSDVLAAGAPQVLEHVAFRPHAVFLWTRLGLPVRDEQDQPALLVFSHPAQRRHEWLDAIFAATGDATVGLHEIAGPHPERPHWLVVAATPAFLALARARPGHVQGRLAHEVFERWTELRFDVAAQATRAAGERSHVFELNDTQRGELREFAGVATRLDDGCVLRLAEVTVARRRERGLRQTLLDLEAANTRLRQSSAAASEASRAKSSFLATMSHEIRTPMNGVIGMVELLALGKLDEEQAHAVGTIRASAHALLRIIDDILDFSKIEAGQLGVERVPVNLMAVVEGACDALVPVAEQRKVALRVFVAPALITPIVGDATRLRQVLTNLIGNAIKFSAGEPERQAKVRVRAEIEAGRVRIDVVDNGIGMNPDAIERIFEPFVQAEASTTRRFGGSGLGLAITRRLVELMGGRIGVKSEPGRGTAFSVWLPRKPAPNSAVAPVSLPDLRGLRVAIVAGALYSSDDLADWLAAGGADIHTFAAGAAATSVAEWLESAEGRPVVVAERSAVSALPPAGWVLIDAQRRPTAIGGAVVLPLHRLRYGAFVQAVARAAGNVAGAGLATTSPRVSSPQVSPAPSAPQPLSSSRPVALGVAGATTGPAEILVAEDDPINRAVIRRQLLALGQRGHIVEDGLQALESWRGGQYELVLTDLNMLQMGGLALARAIRNEEAQRGLARTPIVALTASVMLPDEDKQQNADLDAYLNKPVQLSDLKSAIEHWRKIGREARAAASKPRATSQEKPLVNLVDLQVLKNLVGDDPGILRELLGSYRHSAIEQAGQMRQAFERRDARHVGAIAHKLKSASRSVGAATLGDLCAELEKHQNETDYAALESRLDRFNDLMDATMDAVQTALQELPAS